MVKIFADGAELSQMISLNSDSRISGFTTNPTLMKASGITDYEMFARDVLWKIRVKPVSFEVFANEFDEMERQARIIAAWAANVYVKIPITNTRGESSVPLIGRLSSAGVKVNVTAVFTASQAIDAGRVLVGAPAIVSIFAGRIADAGSDPTGLCRALKYQRGVNVELLWASTRELINIQQAEDCGCDIITISNDLLKKMNLIGKDLTEYSLETVRTFHDDAKASGFSL